MDSKVLRLGLTAAVVLVVAVPLYPELFGLDGVTPFTQLTAFRPQCLVALLALGLLLLVRRSWRLVAALVIVLSLVGGVLVLPRTLSAADPAPAGSRELTILAANVLGGGADAGALAELIRVHKPDLVSLPEAQADVRQAIEARLEGLGYRGYTLQSNEAPVSATSVLVASSLGGVRFHAERLGGGLVTAPPAGKLEQTTTEFAHVVISGGALGKLRLIAYHSFPPLPATVDSWQADLRVLGRWCKASEPVIVAGDFNATVDHAEFRAALGERCRTVSAAVGAGFQGTWPADRPRLLQTQIDHVVVSAELSPLDLTTHDIKGSDHRAVIARVATPSTG